MVLSIVGIKVTNSIAKKVNKKLKLVTSSVIILLGCKNGTIPCLNGNCILKEHFCDGKYQCDDLSDEPQGC